MADHNTLGRKISIWGVNVSGLDAKQAEEKIAAEFADRPVSFQENDQEVYSTTLKELGYSLNEEALLSKLTEIQKPVSYTHLDVYKRQVLDTMDECNELLQDLAVNYRKEGLYRKYLEPVMELAEELSEEYEEEELVEAREDFYRKFRVYEDLLRSFLANEVYSDLLTPEGDLEDALVHMQWIGMEYATIRQAVFLRWQKDGRGSLPYETLRDYMVVISRMTGYEEDDIREYLENSFEELLWEWGYFALITGK